MLIRNTSVLSFHNLSIRENTDVCIKGCRIKRVGQNIEPCGEIIDGSGCYLIPGLVNLHSHTAMTLLRGVAEDVSVEDWFNKYIWMYEKNLTPHDVYVGTLLGAAEMLLSGVTFVADHYFYMGEAAKAYLDAGMRADLAWSVFGVGDDWEARYRQALNFTEEFMDHDPRITVSLGPHSLYLCPNDFLTTVVAKAEELELKLHIHISEEEGQVARSLNERGMTPIQALHKMEVLKKGTILAHAYYATDEDLQLIQESGAGVAHCAKTYMRFGDIHDFLPRALEAGVRCGLGSDGPASNSTMSIFEVARDAALLAKCSTRNPRAARIEQMMPLLCNGGEILGIEGYGTIEEGGLADLVLIRPDTPNMQPEHNIFANILYSLGEPNVDTVIVDGEVVVREGHLVKVDLSALYCEAAAAAERLTRAVSGTPMQTY